MAGILDDINPLTAAEAGMGILQTGIGIVNSIGAKKRQKKLLSQRTGYKTPAEINEVLQATQQNASIGLDPSTMNFLDNKTNSAFASSLDVIQRIGGDPNAMSSIFGQKVDALGDFAEVDTRARMKNFSAYLEALNTVAANKTAEWKSQQDIIKDKLQAAGADLNTANQNISGGLNTVAGGIGAQLTMDLYGNGKKPKINSLAVDGTNQNPLNSLLS